jgi:hypothetical protein
MQYKPIENIVLGKDFNLGATSSSFHVFTLVVLCFKGFQLSKAHYKFHGGF